MPSNELELLIPAGNFEKMQYAAVYGANAMYLDNPHHHTVA